MKSGSYSALVRSTSLSQKTKIATPRGNYTCLLNRGGVQYEPTGTAHSIGELGQRKNKNMEELMKMIVRRTALAVCTLVLALILPTAASAACTGFDDVPESADCYKSEIYILRSMRLRKARGTDASPRMRRLRPVNGLSCSAAPTTSM